MVPIVCVQIIKLFYILEFRYLTFLCRMQSHGVHGWLIKLLSYVFLNIHM